MTEVDYKFDELKGITGLGDRASILYLLKSRIASGLENKEEGSEKIPKSIGAAWIEAADQTDILAQENPELAFQLALTLSLLPRSTYPKQENVHRWMRGDGPVLLAKESVRKPFLQYLESDPQAPEFIAKMQEYMNFDITKFDKEEALHEPNCFLSVATMFLVTKLEGLQDNQSVSPLVKSAKDRLADPQVSKVVRYYSGSEDTAWIVKELEPFLAK